MKLIIKYVRTATIGAVFFFSSHTRPISLVTTAAWLKCKLGLSMPTTKTASFSTNYRTVSFENDLLDVIDLYDIPQLYTHWAIQLLSSNVNNQNLIDNTKTKLHCPDYSNPDTFNNLEFYEKIIKVLDLYSDDTYEDASEKLVELLQPEIDEDEIDIDRRNTITTLLNLTPKKNGMAITTEDIEEKIEFESIKTALYHSTFLANIFEKIGKNRLTKLWKTIVIKADGIILPHDSITEIPVTGDTCTISATLPIETFAQLLDADGLQCILSDDPIEEEDPCLVDAQKFLQKHTWIRSGIKYLQQHDNVWNSIVARYINMQIVFTYTFNIKEFASDTICINYLLFSQLSKWAQNPPAVTTRYRPFKTIEIIVNN